MSKRVLISLISVVFAIIVVFALIFAFKVNKVQVKKYLLDDSEQRLEEINKKLDTYVGKNLIFLNTSEIKKELSVNPFFECVSVDKSLPNTLSVVIKERRGVFILSIKDKCYLLDQDGIVLSEYTGDKNSRDVIRLELVDISIEDIVLGQKINTNFNAEIINAFAIAKSVELTDCIDVMTVENKVVQVDVVFDTYTEVRIRVPKSMEKGSEKAKKAFELYDNEKSDYIKSYNEIVAYELDGEIVAKWTRHGE